MKLEHTTNLEDNTEVTLTVVYEYTHPDLQDDAWLLDSLDNSEIYYVVSITHDDKEIQEFIEKYKEDLENEIIDTL